MAANRIVYIYVDFYGVGAIYMTTLKSAKQKIHTYEQYYVTKESPSIIEWLYSIGAVNAKTQFLCYDLKYTIETLHTYYADEMEFVGLTIDSDNCFDVAEYYDILATRMDVPILENPTIEDIIRGLNKELPDMFKNNAILNKALLIKDIYDEILKRGVVVGEVPLDIEVKE